MIDRVFDADGHVVEQDRELLDFFDPPYRGRAELLGNPFFPTLDGWHRQAMTIADGKRPGVDEDDAAAWLRLMDRTGIEETVLYPTAGLAQGLIKDPDWGVAVCRAYNNFLYENYIQVSPRIHAVALLPMQDPQEAVKELRRAVKELKMLGGLIAPVGLPFPAGHPSYHPVYAEAEKLGCAIALHGAPAVGLGFDFFTRLIQARALTHPFSQLIHLTNIIFEGVLEKYPGLRLLSLEAGASWVPFLMDRLDLEWDKRGSRQAPLLKKKPSEYLKSGQVFYNCDVKEHIIPTVVAMVGEDLLLYASDFPHEHDQDDTIATLRSREDLSQRVRAKILYHNGRKVYGLR
ncbi:MAG: amidohydrolase family protein [Deltaproteobacteria bacterium]|nr:amidohydrolase family protein [Deltaproteobacteria bacterium]